MKKQITFKVEDTDSFLPLTKAYFLGSGFKIKSQHHNKISFSRGNILLNFVTFNPLTWKSDVNVSITNDIVVADFNINAIGQIVTPKEEQLWSTLIENYKIAIVSRQDMSGENTQQLRLTKKASWKYVRWSLIGAIVFGVPFGFLEYYTDIKTLTSVGAGLGAAIFVMYKVDKEKNKTSASK